MGNEVLNIFSFCNFSEKSNIFGENGKKILGGHDHSIEGLSYTNNEYNLFYGKLDAKCFHVK